MRLACHTYDERMTFQSVDRNVAKASRLASAKVAALPSYGVVDDFAAARLAFVFVLW